MKSGGRRILEDTRSLKSTRGAWERVVQMAGVGADGVKGTRLRGGRWAQSHGFRGPCRKGGIPYRTQRKTRPGLAPLRDEVLILVEEDGVGRSAVRMQEEENGSDEPSKAAAAAVRARNNGGLSALEVEINDKLPSAGRLERGAMRVPQPWVCDLALPCPRWLYTLVPCPSSQASIFLSVKHE